MEINPKGKAPLVNSNVPAALSPFSSWFRSIPEWPNGPSSSRPPIFYSFSDLASSLAMKTLQQPLIPKQPIVVNWSVLSSSKVGLVSYDLSLGVLSRLQRLTIYTLSSCLIKLHAKKTLVHQLIL